MAAIMCIDALDLISRKCALAKDDSCCWDSCTLCLRSCQTTGTFDVPAGREDREGVIFFLHQLSTCILVQGAAGVKGGARQICHSSIIPTVTSNEIFVWPNVCSNRCRGSAFSRSCYDAQECIMTSWLAVNDEVKHVTWCGCAGSC